MPPITVRVAFGPASRPGAVAQELVVEAAPSDTVAELKARVAAAAGGKVTADDLKLEFGPNARNIGRQYFRDPTVNEGELRLEQYSLLAWIERFPLWVVTGAAGGGGPGRMGVGITREAMYGARRGQECVACSEMRSKRHPHVCTGTCCPSISSTHAHAATTTTVAPLAARLLPPTPPPPGVAIQRAAAQAEQKNPDDVVADARSTVGCRAGQRGAAEPRDGAVQRSAVQQWPYSLVQLRRKLRQARL